MSRWVGRSTATAIAAELVLLGRQGNETTPTTVPITTPITTRLWPRPITTPIANPHHRNNLTQRVGEERKEKKPILYLVSAGEVLKVKL